MTAAPAALHPLMKANRVPNFARVAVALLFALIAAAVSAQYPARPIRLLVPNPPGGASDTIARIIAPKLAEALGQSVVVDNRPGSNGNLSSELAAKAAPDGYTLLLGQDSQIVISPHLYATLAVDTLKQLTPVATLITTQMVLAVNPALPVKNLLDFLDYSRRTNPPLAYASIGNGSQHHLTMEMLKARAHIDLTHVPYKGGGPATIALLAGEVAAMFGGNSVTAQIKSGRLRGLAVASAQRSATFPDLPALGESFPGLEVTSWLGLFAPAGVPAPILARLHNETNRLLAEPDTRERVKSVGGLDPYISTPEEFAALIRTQYLRYGEVVKAVGAKID